MIYTVTFNPAIDYVLYTNSIKTGITNRSINEECYFGGKGINISTVLNTLSVENIALGFVAGFTGEAIENFLSEKNIQTDFIHLEKGFSRINVKIKDQTETEINGQGPEISQKELNLLFNKLKKLSSDDILILAGSVPNSLPQDIYSCIISSLTDKGVKCIVDANGSLLTETLKHKPFLIKPNKQELCDIFNIEDISTDDILTYGYKLKEMGAVNVLISLGNQGVFLIDEFGNHHFMGNADGKVLNTVGSGDSMVAGFIAGYLHKKDYPFALKLGAVCGNATAMEKGLASLDKIKELFNKI